MRSHIGPLLSTALLLCAAAPAAVAQTLPTPWNSTDVGSPAIRGSASFESDRFTVNGGGTDIGGTADQFYLIYRPLSGDGEIVARVESLTRTDNQAKAGVMIREALTPDSRYAMTTITAAKGHRFQRRPITGDMSISSATVSGGAPGWVKVARTGDTFVASWSTDGVTWTSVGTDTIPMGETVYIGLAVTSRDRRRLARAIFSNVTVRSSASGNQAPAVTITQPANGTQYSLPANVTIDATATDPENRMASVGFYVNNALITTDTTAPYSAPWSPSAAGTYTLAAMAQDADGGSSWSISVSVTVQGPNSPPAVNLTSPANAATFTAPATINMTAAASDPENQLARVQFLSGSTVLATDTTAPFAWTWSNVAAGTYSLTAKAYDSAGAVATSAAVTVTVGAATSAPRLVVFTASADHATNVTSYFFEVFAAGANPATATAIASSDLGKPTPAANNEITVDRSALFSGLAPGNYVATVTAVGPGGRTRSTPVTFTR
jgi:regulation of enolase protein 1 (concanavalin A-like superfamily)